MIGRVGQTHVFAHVWRRLRDQWPGADPVDPWDVEGVDERVARLLDLRCKVDYIVQINGVSIGASMRVHKDPRSANDVTFRDQPLNGYRNEYGALQAAVAEPAAILPRVLVQAHYWRRKDGALCFDAVATTPQAVLAVTEDVSLQGTAWRRPTNNRDGNPFYVVEQAYLPSAWHTGITVSNGDDVVQLQPWDGLIVRRPLKEVTTNR